VLFRCKLHCGRIFQHSKLLVRFISCITRYGRVYSSPRLFVFGQCYCAFTEAIIWVFCNPIHGPVAPRSLVPPQGFARSDVNTLPFQAGLRLSGLACSLWCRCSFSNFLKPSCSPPPADRAIPTTPFPVPWEIFTQLPSFSAFTLRWTSGS